MANVPPIKRSLLLTCEHATNAVPEEYQTFFRSQRAQRDLRHHRGFDPGALEIAEFLSQQLGAPLISGDVSRLLVELNRSVDAADLFSRYLRTAKPETRRQILERFYMPYRRRVESALAEIVSIGRVAVHISIHTFTPVLAGQRRDFDVGILFDPARERESQISQRLIRSLREIGLRAEPNRPYLGVDDGLTTFLRTRFAPGQYVGIEVEVNNRFARYGIEKRVQRCEMLRRAVQEVLDANPHPESG